jgi:hypothetical protein
VLQKVVAPAGAALKADIAKITPKTPIKHLGIVVNLV